MLALRRTRVLATRRRVGCCRSNSLLVGCGEAQQATGPAAAASVARLGAFSLHWSAQALTFVEAALASIGGVSHPLRSISGVLSWARGLISGFVGASHENCSFRASQPPAVRSKAVRSKSVPAPCDVPHHRGARQLRRKPVCASADAGLPTTSGAELAEGRRSCRDAGGYHGQGSIRWQAPFNRRVPNRAARPASEPSLCGHHSRAPSLNPNPAPNLISPTVQIPHRSTELYCRPYIPPQYVSSVSELITAIGNHSVDRVVAQAGTYRLNMSEINTSMRRLCRSAAICINRTLTIEAAVPGAVVLDAMNEKRVFEIQPGGMAELIGLNITGGSTNSVCSVLGL